MDFVLLHRKSVMYWTGMKHVAGLFVAAKNIMVQIMNKFMNIAEPICTKYL